MHPHFFKFSPMREAAWRHQRVLAIWQGGAGPLFASRGDDKYVRTLLKFTQDYREAERRAEEEVAAPGRGLDDSAAMTQLFARKPGLWYARQLHHDVDSELRSLVQARILARETDDQIAARFATLPAAIHWYEKLFFHVRDRFHCRDWVVKSILGTWSTHLGERDGARIRHALYKSVAYHGGTHALDAVISSFAATPYPDGADVERWFEQTFKQKLKVHAMAALQSVEISKNNVMPLLNQCLSVLAAEKLASHGEQGDSDLQSALANMLQEIPPELFQREVSDADRA